MIALTEHEMWFLAPGKGKATNLPKHGELTQVIGHWPREQVAVTFQLLGPLVMSDLGVVT